MLHLVPAFHIKYVVCSTTEQGLASDVRFDEKDAYLLASRKGSAMYIYASTK